MIPTLILAGLLVGRWWALAVAAVAWPALLVAQGIGSGLGFVVGAAALAVINAAVGVTVHHAVRAMIRCARARIVPRTSRSGPPVTVLRRHRARRPNP